MSVEESDESREIDEVSNVNDGDVPPRLPVWNFRIVYQSNRHQLDTSIIFLNGIDSTCR
jgi:hypothetical protein